MICDKFGAQRRHKEKGNILIFDPGKACENRQVHDVVTRIQLKLPVVDKTEGSEQSEGYRKVQDISEQNASTEHTNNQNNMPQIFEEISDNNSNNITTTNDKPLDNTTKSSDLSDPSGSASVSGFYRI